MTKHTQQPTSPFEAVMRPTFTTPVARAKHVKTPTFTPPRHRVEIPLVTVYVYCTGAFECSDDKTFLYDN